VTATVINVTAEHIANGKRGECEFCPVALAFQAALDLGPFASIDVLIGCATITTGGRSIAVSLPEDADQFIVNFDDGEPVEPFSFTVDYPQVTP
jgi:hypothetical protein